MLKKIAKWCAKIALDFLPDAVAYLIKLATDKSADSTKAKVAIHVVRQISADAIMLAEMMEDGTITDEEQVRIKNRAEMIAEEIGALL